MAADPSGGLKKAMATRADRTATQVASAYKSTVGEVSSESLGDFLKVALPLIKAGMKDAHALASTSYRTQRKKAPEAKGTFAVPAAGKPSEEQIRKSLIYTGFAAPAKRETGKASFEVPLKDPDRETTVEMVKAAAARRVIKQGMDTMAAAARADRYALGWARVAQMDSKTCYFCSMLASRGPVYKKDSLTQSDRRFKDNLFPPAVMTGELASKVHDHCRCVLVPVWSKDAAVVKQADELYATWRQVQHEYSGMAKLLGWDMIRVWRLWWDDRIDAEIERYLARG